MIGKLWPSWAAAAAAARPSAAAANANANAAAAEQVREAEPATAPLPPPAAAGPLPERVALAQPGPSLVPELAEGRMPAIGVLVLELEGQELATLLEAVLRSVAQKPFLPVFLTDRRDLEPFRHRRLRFEHLPPGPPGDDPEDFEIYLLARLDLWAVKWRLARIIAVGRAASLRLERWRRSANASPALLELLGPSPAAPGAGEPTAGTATMPGDG